MSNPNPMGARCGLEDCDCEYTIDYLVEALEGLVAEYGIDSTSVILLTNKCRNAWGQAGAAIAKAKRGRPR